MWEADLDKCIQLLMLETVMIGSQPFPLERLCLAASSLRPFVFVESVCVQKETSASETLKVEV